MITITNDEARAILSVLGPFEAEPCHERGDHERHTECSYYREAELQRIYRVENRLRDALGKARRQPATYAELAAKPFEPVLR